MPVAESDEDVTQPPEPSNTACESVRWKQGKSGYGPGDVEKIDIVAVKSAAPPAGAFTLKSLTFEDVTSKSTSHVLWRRAHLPADRVDDLLSGETITVYLSGRRPSPIGSIFGERFTRTCSRGPANHSVASAQEIKKSSQTMKRKGTKTLDGRSTKVGCTYSFDVRYFSCRDDIVEVRTWPGKHVHCDMCRGLSQLRETDHLSTEAISRLETLFSLFPEMPVQQAKDTFKKEVVSHLLLKHGLNSEAELLTKITTQQIIPPRDYLITNKDVNNVKLRMKGRTYKRAEDEAKSLDLLVAEDAEKEEEERTIVFHQRLQEAQFHSEHIPSGKNPYDSF